MKKVALALLVVLTAASVSFAGWTPIVTEIDNGNALLQTYSVAIEVPLGEGGISTIDACNITGDVHQVQPNWGAHTETPDETYKAAMGANNVFDTHFLGFASVIVPNPTGPDGPVWTEACDDSNPGELAGAGSMAFFGIGDLLCSDADHVKGVVTMSKTESVELLEFAQVVIPVGGTATVSGNWTNIAAADAGDAMVPFEIIIGIPEPSTIVMLVLGALCLLGIRRK